MHFEWDRGKADNNYRKHKVTFDEAATVFYDPLAATFPDPDHSQSERRFISVGCSSRNRLLMVAHTEQGETIRIISARPATPHERRRHET
jgi:uncharacterized DUF497 family protein